MKFSQFVPIGLQTWVPLAILNSNWLKFSKIFSSETIWPNGICNLAGSIYVRSFIKLIHFVPI